MEWINKYLTYFSQVDITQFVYTLILLIAGTSLLKKGFPKIAKTVMMVAVYLLSRGIITTGMLLEWWTQIPSIVSALFFIPQ